MRIRSFVIACGVLATALPTLVTPVRACSFPGNLPHTLDPQAQAADTAPPGAPVVGAPSIKRGKGPEYHGCAQSMSSCDDAGTILLPVSATDDQTATASLGYRIEVLRGSLPSGLSLPDTAVRPPRSSGLLLVWTDGSSDDQEGLDFALSVRAVDLAGNEGPPTSVEIHDSGSGGCSMGGLSAADNPGAIVGALLVLTSLLRRGRRRQR